VSNRAVFIDRDGVIVRIKMADGAPRAPFRRDEFEILPRVKDGLELLKGLGFLRILVTNQPDVSYGYLTEEEWRWMQDRVEELGFDDVYICRHTRDEGCGCKKPKPGMLISAAKKWDIDLSSSYMVGDTENDIGAARSAGVQVILISTPYNTALHDYDYGVADFWAAAILIQLIHSPQKEAKR